MVKKSFENWMKEVDALVFKYTGVSVHDLPDCCFHDWYDDGVGARSAAKRAVKEAS